MPLFFVTMAKARLRALLSKMITSAIVITSSLRRRSYTRLRNRNLETRNEFEVLLI